MRAERTYKPSALLAGLFFHQHRPTRLAKPVKHGLERKCMHLRCRLPYGLGHSRPHSRFACARTTPSPRNASRCSHGRPLHHPPRRDRLSQHPWFYYFVL